MSQTEVKVKFHIPDDHKLHFVTSVWGGITSRGMLEIHFLHDRPPLPKRTTNKIDDSGVLVEQSSDTAGYSLVRSVQTGVVMDIESAREFLRWLQEKISAYENLLEGDNDAGDDAQ